MPLLHDAMNAYLSPLLKKHSVGGVLSLEDLNSSMEAAKAVLEESPNDFVLVSLSFCFHPRDLCMAVNFLTKDFNFAPHFRLLHLAFY